MSRPLFKTRASERGAVIPIVALLLPVLMIMTSFAVDLGRQRVLRRDLQADADVIALDLVRLADGRTMDEILSAGPLDPFLDAVNASFTRNGVEPVGSLAELSGVVTYGVWDEVTATFTPTAAPDVPNAVRVTLEDDLDYFFQPGRGGASRSATALSTAEGVFSVGSRLVGLDTAESELLNPLLDVLLHGLGPVPSDPSGVSLDVLSYERLVSADIDVNELLGIIQADLVSAGVDVATPEQVLETEVTLLHIIQASADALASSGEGVDVDAAVALLELAASIDPSITLKVGDLLSAFVSEPGAVIGAEVNAFDLLLVGAQVVNEDNVAAADVQLPAAPFQAIPLVDRIATPSASVQVSLIEPPQIGSGPPGDPAAVAKTSQVRVGARVGLELDVNIGSLLDIGRFSGLPSVAKITLDLPLRVTAGNATAALTDVDCPDDPAMRTLGLSVETGTANVAVGSLVPAETPDADQRVQLATVELAGVEAAAITVGADAKVGDPAAQPIPPLYVGETYEVGAGEIGLRNLLQVDLGVDVFGLSLINEDGVLESLVNALISKVLGTVLGVVDQFLLSPVLDLLGAGVASADVKAIDARCGMPTLVE